MKLTNNQDNWMSSALKAEAEIERLQKLVKEQGQEIAITREKDEALEAENERLRALQRCGSRPMTMGDIIGNCEHCDSLMDQINKQKAEREADVAGLIEYEQKTIDLMVENERLRKAVRDQAGVELSEENDRLIDENKQLRAQFQLNQRELNRQIIRNLITEVRTLRMLLKEAGKGEP